MGLVHLGGAAALGDEGLLGVGEGLDLVALEHGHLVSGPPERERGGEAADAPTTITTCSDISTLRLARDGNGRYQGPYAMVTPVANFCFAPPPDPLGRPHARRSSR